MQTFKYRLPRFATNFPVELLVGETTVPGRCTNISEAGMRGVFREPMPVGTVGLLTLNHAPWKLDVTARVAYFSADQMVLRLICNSTYERVKLRRFIAYLAG